MRVDHGALGRLDGAQDVHTEQYPQPGAFGA
jgi:hypothetical protein